MSDIFLSFSGETSKKFALALEELIKETGIGTTFLADNNIRSGDDWLQKIYDNLKECRIGIVIFTEENRDNNKWLYLEYGVLSYKVKTQDTDNLKVIPIFLDFKDSDWTDNPLKIHQSISFVEDFGESISELLSDINQMTNKKKNINFSKELLEKEYTTYNEKLKNTLSSTQPKESDTQQPINSTNHSMNKSTIAQILQHIHNFINKNQCILYSHIEYDKLEQHLIKELKWGELTLANSITYLSDNNYIIFVEEEDLDGYPVEYIGLSIQGQKVIRRRSRRR